MKLLVLLCIAVFLILTFCSTLSHAFGEVVERVYCPNRCTGVGKCLNMTLSDADALTYECDCGYPSKYQDCSDQANIPIVWTIVLSLFVIALFLVTFILFERCNKSFDARQKFYSPDSVLAR